MANPSEAKPRHILDLWQKAVLTVATVGWLTAHSSSGQNLYQETRDDIRNLIGKIMPSPSNHLKLD